MGKDTTEGGTGDIRRDAEESAAQDPSQQPATVHFLDSNKYTFYVPVRFLKLVSQWSSKNPDEPALQAYKQILFRFPQYWGEHAQN